MKSILLNTLLMVISVSSLYGQLFNDGGEVIIQNGALLHIQGDFTNQGGEIKNEGLIEIGGNWVNTVMSFPMTPGSGTVQFIGSEQTIGGVFPTLFTDFKIDNNQSITLTSNIGIGNSIDLNNGIIELNENILHILNPLNSSITAAQGGVRAETSDNYGHVRWDIGEEGGQVYTIPFMNNFETSIPLSFEVTEAGEGTEGYMLFSTYGTAEDNTPLPIQVANIDLEGDSSGLGMVDRYWIINAFDYTTVPISTSSLSYDDVNEAVGSNNISLEELELIFWDSDLQSWSQIIESNTNGNEVTAANNDNYGNFGLWSKETTAVNELKPLKQLSAFPNPVRNNLAISIETSNSDPKQLKVKDILGNIIYKELITTTQSTISHSIDVSDFPNGIFFLTVESRTEQSVLKFYKN